MVLIAVPFRTMPPRGTVKSAGELVRLGWPPNSLVDVAGFMLVCALTEKASASMTPKRSVARNIGRPPVVPWGIITFLVNFIDTFPVSPAQSCFAALKRLAGGPTPPARQQHAIARGPRRRALALW